MNKLLIKVDEQILLLRNQYIRKQEVNLQRIFELSEVDHLTKCLHVAVTIQIYIIVAAIRQRKVTVAFDNFAQIDAAPSLNLLKKNHRACWYWWVCEVGVDKLILTIAESENGDEENQDGTHFLLEFNIIKGI